MKEREREREDPDMRSKERERNRRNKTHLAPPPLPPPTITASTIRLHKIKAMQIKGGFSWILLRPRESLFRPLSLNNLVGEPMAIRLAAALR